MSKNSIQLEQITKWCSTVFVRKCKQHAALSYSCAHHKMESLTCNLFLKCSTFLKNSLIKKTKTCVRQ